MHEPIYAECSDAVMFMNLLLYFCNNIYVYTHLGTIFCCLVQLWQLFVALLELISYMQRMIDTWLSFVELNSDCISLLFHSCLWNKNIGVSG